MAIALRICSHLRADSWRSPSDDRIKSVLRVCLQNVNNGRKFLRSGGLSLMMPPYSPSHLVKIIMQETSTMSPFSWPQSSCVQTRPFSCFSPRLRLLVAQRATSLPFKRMGSGPLADASPFQELPLQDKQGRQISTQSFQLSSSNPPIGWEYDWKNLTDAEFDVFLQTLSKTTCGVQRERFQTEEEYNAFLERSKRYTNVVVQELKRAFKGVDFSKHLRQRRRLRDYDDGLDIEAKNDDESKRTIDLPAYAEEEQDTIKSSQLPSSTNPPAGWEYDWDNLTDDEFDNFLKTLKKITSGVYRERFSTAEKYDAFRRRRHRYMRIVVQELSEAFKGVDLCKLIRQGKGLECFDEGQLVATNDDNL